MVAKDAAGGKFNHRKEGLRMDIWKERVPRLLLYLFLAICTFSTLFPFLNVLAVSLSSGEAIRAGNVSIWPRHLTWDAYRNLIDDGQLFVAMKNTVVMTVVGTSLNMLVTIMAAYPLSKMDLRGRGPVLGMIIFTMLFSGGLIPQFLLIKSLGLMNTYWSLWLSGLISTYNLFVLKTFFEGLPSELEESASIDGAKDWVVLVRIVLPLALPVIAALTLFYAVGWWNAYYNVLIFIKSSTQMSLMVKLYQMIDNLDPALLVGDSANANNTLPPEGVRAGAAMLASLPILIIYPFLQKYFVKGVLMGSVKG
ncbi:carbohydrate ABC transporter permease [Paenibacillus alginolyticus]|uniref:carbohydrate ABC transporter permease n=1 Tax=Paenibacillus alginolyticus TaxID=59839 RepID=UPI000411E9FD|nr:carbohydrate ABC transporter permease [Paenibacillus alginolyticus]MCY9669693.1 carbohydrate ABC transporter permease [Paenibacillus alginolyticus]